MISIMLASFFYHLWNISFKIIMDRYVFTIGSILYVLSQFYSVYSYLISIIGVLSLFISKRDVIYWNLFKNNQRYK